MATKLLAAALLAVALLEPARTTQRPKKGANDFLILIDNGESMALHGGEQLAAQLKQANANANSWLSELRDQFRLESFVFGRRLAKSHDFAEADFSGKRSDMLEALGSIRQRYAKRPLAGILLFSDGNATDRDRLPEISFQAPVYPVLQSASDSIRDLGVEAVAVNSSAFEDAPVTLTARIRARGLAGQSCKITVTGESGTEVVSESRAITKADEQLPVRLRFRGAGPEVSFFRINVNPLQRGIEITRRNNSESIAADRGRGRYRILYNLRPAELGIQIPQALDPARRRSAIDRIDPRRQTRAQVCLAWPGRRNQQPTLSGFQGQLPEAEESYDRPVLIRLNTKNAAELNDGFPKDREALFGEFDALILDDLEAAFFTASQQELVEEFVSRRGGSLLMLGGQESFELGGYARGPIGRLLPVYLDAAMAEDLPGGATFNLSRQGWLEPWARLRATEKEEELRLAHMPQFLALNRLRAIKPGASLLAAAIDRTGDEFPAVAVHTFGEGRAGALMIGDIWRWGMEDPAMRQDMEKWWRQLSRWLVGDVPDFIEVATEWRGNPGAAVRRIEVRVRDRAFRAEENATVQLDLETPAEGTEPVKLFAEPSLEEAGLFTAEYPCVDPGPHRISVSARDVDGEDLGLAQAGWVWAPARDEYASLDPDREFLTQVAERSGGRMVEVEGLATLVKELAKLEAPVMETRARPLWHTPWWLLVVVLLLATEWGVRRWRGLG